VASLSPAGAGRVRALLYGLVLAAALAAVGAVLLARARAEVEHARARLLAGDAGTEAAFARLSGRPFVGARAAAGRRLAAAARGRPDAAALDASPAAWPTFAADLTVLLDRAWDEGRPSSAETLALLAERAGSRLGNVYLAALALEAGDDAGARERWRSDPAAFAARGTGREVVATLALRAAGASTIVRDRRGRRVGHLAGEGSLVLDPGVDPAWVPRALVISLSLLPPSPARRGLRLGLDLELSRLAQSVLHGRQGSIVLLDPHTGAILAAVSDPRTAARGGTPAFDDWREPASISKVLTTAAALRAGLDPDAEIARMTCTGSERYRGGILWCPHAAGALGGLDRAMAWSCNVAFANLGVRVGREALLDELRQWGFDRGVLGLGPGGLAPSGRIVQAAGSERQLADLSIGLEATTLTPLHAALLAAVIGDGGRMPEPYLLEAEQGPLGLVARPFPRPPAREVIDPAWVGVLARSMTAVARYGTGAGVAPPGLPVAMKTGVGATWRLGYHANYIGVAPWPEARIAFCVRITHQPTSRHVSRTAREVLGALLEGLARRPTAFPAQDRPEPHTPS